MQVGMRPPSRYQAPGWMSCSVTTRPLRHGARFPLQRHDPVDEHERLVREPHAGREGVGFGESGAEHPGDLAACEFEAHLAVESDSAVLVALRRRDSEPEGFRKLGSVTADARSPSASREGESEVTPGCPPAERGEAVGKPQVGFMGLQQCLLGCSGDHGAPEQLAVRRQRSCRGGGGIGCPARVRCRRRKAQRPALQGRPCTAIGCCGGRAGAETASRRAVTRDHVPRAPCHRGRTACPAAARRTAGRDRPVPVRRRAGRAGAEALRSRPAPDGRPIWPGGAVRRGCGRSSCCTSCPVPSRGRGALRRRRPSLSPPGNRSLPAPGQGWHRRRSRGPPGRSLPGRRCKR